MEQVAALKKQVTIFSIYPEAMKATRGRSMPVSEFHIEAGSLENPAILVIEDNRESVYSGEDAQGNRLYDYRPILAMKTAACLVNEWRDLIPNSTQGRCIGIAIADGELPTKEEIAAADAAQSAFFSGLVAEARQHHMDGHSHLIKKKHRMAATYLKLTSEPWIHETMAPGERKNCPLCQSIIPSAAIICPTCSRQIAAMPKELADMQRVPVQPQLPGNRPAA